MSLALLLVFVSGVVVSKLLYSMKAEDVTTAAHTLFADPGHAQFVGRYGWLIAAAIATLAATAVVVRCLLCVRRVVGWDAPTNTRSGYVSGPPPQGPYTNTKRCLHCQVNDAKPGFDFCSVEHGREHKRRASTGGSFFGSVRMCKHCLVQAARPGFDFCTHSHGKEYKLANSKYDASLNQKTPPAQSVSLCPVCNTKPLSGYPHCSKACEADACLYCKAKRKSVDSKTKMSHDFCSRDHAQKFEAQCGVKHGNVRLLKLDPTHNKYKDYENQFRTSWAKSKGAAPSSVEAIFQVYNETLFKRYTAYRDQIAKQMPNGDANERRRWHGTGATCAWAADAKQNYAPCLDAGCATCNICQVGFLLSKSQTKHAWGRFGGPSIYFAPNSSKSHDYSTNQPKLGAGRRVMLLAKVVCGNVKKYSTDQSHLTAPPAGYHAVVGEDKIKAGDPSGTLNYSELVVYDEAACLVTAIVIYKE